MAQKLLSSKWDNLQIPPCFGVLGLTLSKPSRKIYVRGVFRRQQNINIKLYNTIVCIVSRPVSQLYEINIEMWLGSYTEP